MLHSLLELNKEESPVLGEHVGPQIPCCNSADPWENQYSKPYNGPCARVDQAYPFNQSINQVQTAQGFYMEIELSPFSADLKHLV
jgi:hypothetical protein